MKNPQEIPFQSPEDAVKEKMEVLRKADPQKYADPLNGEEQLRADAIVVARMSARPRE